MNNEVNKVLFIINKYAGTGYVTTLEQKIISTCARHNAECTIEFTARRGHATELARAAVNKYDLVAAVGGDGTMNEVAQGLLHTDTPMGIIPRGSGNGLARHLHIPLSVEGATESLFHSRRIPMDTFTINGKLSLNVSGIGFDAHVAHLFGKGGKRGLAGYVRTTLREYFQFNEFEINAFSEKVNIINESFVVAIANSSQYGNNARIAPHASVCDGKLNITFLKKVPLYRIDLVLALFGGTVDTSRLCKTMETESIRFGVNHPVAFHADGEPVGRDTVFDVSVLPGSLNIFVPAGADGI